MEGCIGEHAESSVDVGGVDILGLNNAFDAKPLWSFRGPLSRLLRDCK